MYYKLCLKIETLNVGIPKAHCVHEINVSRARKDECLELLLWYKVNKTWLNKCLTETDFILSI